jgi:hypothetical protein
MIYPECMDAQDIAEFEAEYAKILDEEYQARMLDELRYLGETK